MRSHVKSEDYQNFLDDLNGYYQEQEKGEEKKFIGERLKSIRELQGISIEKLAKIAGVREDLLNDIEKLKVYPDLGTIIKLSRALRIGTGLLLDEASGYSYSVVRKGDRKAIHRTPSGTKDHPSYLYQTLSTGVKARHMEAFIVTLTGKGEEAEPSCHEGEEFFMVMEGEVRVKLGNKEELISEGDSIYYHSTIPHMLQSVGKTDAVILAVVYTG